MKKKKLDRKQFTRSYVARLHPALPERQINAAG
jgi:hypothetical protein